MLSLPVESVYASQPEQSASLVDTLSAIAVQLRALRTLLSKPPTPEQVSSVAQGLALIEEEVSALLAELRLTGEASAGEEAESQTERLAEALGRLVEERAEALGVASRVQVTGEARRLDPLIAVLLYRLTRAALAAVARHRAVHHLRLALHYGRESLQLTLTDDGIASEEEASSGVAAPPFAPATTGQEALEVLDQQLRAAGGRLSISATPGQGHQISASLPYERPPGAGLPALSPTRATETPAQRLRLLVVAGQPVMRAGLRRLLESYPDLQVIGEAANGIQASGEALELGPQVVLFDLPRPDEQAMETLRQMKQLSPDTRILILSASSQPEQLAAALRAGADGYLLREVAPDELVQAIRLVAQGETIVQPQLAARLLTRLSQRTEGTPATTSLTARERQVLWLLARGLRNKEIARRLQVSERTVNFHLANIYQKLHVSGRTEALSRALEEGLLSLEALTSTEA